MQLYDRIVDRDLMVRRMYVVANHAVPEREAAEDAPLQFSLFDDVEEVERRQAAEQETLAKERNLQKALLLLKGKYGKNAVLKGMNYVDGATARERNGQVGGHKA